VNNASPGSANGRPQVAFDRERVEALLEQLERMAAGERTKLPLSPARDTLDAIAFAVNVIEDELQWTNTRIAEAERKRAEEMVFAKERAERANEAKSVFLRTASHEFRTPIAAILGRWTRRGRTQRWQRRTAMSHRYRRPRAGLV